MRTIRVLVVVWLGMMLSLILIYQDGYRSLIDTWSRTGEYKHGYLIVPMAAFLAYLSREKLKGVVLRPDWKGVVAMILSGLVWLAGELGDINLLVHAGVVALLPASLIAVFGSGLLERVPFPLFYTLLAIPFDSKWIMPFLQSVTSIASAEILQIRFPVYREGTILSLPGMDYHVAEACSGYRFLLAMAVTMLAVSWVFYDSIAKRLVFVFSSIFVAIVINIIRVSGTIYVSEIYGAKNSLYMDHVLYGWQLYASIMVIMVLVGKIWADKNRFSPNNVSLSQSIHVKISNIWGLSLTGIIAMFLIRLIAEISKS